MNSVRPSNDTEWESIKARAAHLLASVTILPDREVEALAALAAMMSLTTYCNNTPSHPERLKQAGEEFAACVSPNTLEAFAALARLAIPHEPGVRDWWPSN
jgi:hypothetical protein